MMEKLELKGGKEVDVKYSPGQGSLNRRDWLIGLLMAVGTPILTYLYDFTMAFLSYQPAELDWRTMLKFGISAGALYIGKNLFDKGKIIIDKADLREARK